MNDFFNQVEFWSEQQECALFPYCLKSASSDWTNSSSVEQTRALWPVFLNKKTYLLLAAVHFGDSTQYAWSNNQNGFNQVTCPSGKIQVFIILHEDFIDKFSWLLWDFSLNEKVTGSLCESYFSYILQKSANIFCKYICSLETNLWTLRMLAVCELVRIELWEKSIFSF